MALSNLTDPAAVAAAIDECRRLGEPAFLAKYGFDRPTRYVLEADGETFPPKAILAAAHGVQHPQSGPLRSWQFSGGDQSGAALRRLGYEMRPINPSEPAGTVDDMSIGEQVHLFIRWSPSLEPHTIERHMERIEGGIEDGVVWWGKFGKSLGASRIAQLDRDLRRGARIHVYLWGPTSFWRTDLIEVTEDPERVPDPDIPDYYAKSDCGTFLKLSNWIALPQEQLDDLLILDSDPTRGSVTSRLRGMTTVLIVREIGDAQPLRTEPLRPEPSQLEMGLDEAVAELARRFRDAGLDYGERHVDLVRTAVVSLATRRFVLLTGTSGSGKTRLGLGIGQWFGPGRLLTVAVRPDWTGPDALLGFENALSAPTPDGRFAWTVPDALEFVLRAAGRPDEPHMLLLDEMNLAHVERYFSDFLSGMESGEPVVPNLHCEAGGWYQDPVTPRIPVPQNLHVVGTVNIDETTYMFSPKVLDRANTLEFRVASSDLRPTATPLRPVAAGSPAAVAAFVRAAGDDLGPGDEDRVIADELRKVHEVLTAHDREFGHRVFFEALRFAGIMRLAGETRSDHALDLQVFQKVLPKIHGSVRQVRDVLQALQALSAGAAPDLSARWPLTHDKTTRMLRRLDANQFVTFAE